MNHGCATDGGSESFSCLYLCLCCWDSARLRSDRIQDDASHSRWSSLGVARPWPAHLAPWQLTVHLTWPCHLPLAHPLEETWACFLRWCTQTLSLTGPSGHFYSVHMAFSCGGFLGVILAPLRCRTSCHFLSTVLSLLRHFSTESAHSLWLDYGPWLRNL